MITCPKCGAENPDRRTACKKCHSKIRNWTQTEKTAVACVWGFGALAVIIFAAVLYSSNQPAGDGYTPSAQVDTYQPESRSSTSAARTPEVEPTPKSDPVVEDGATASESDPKPAPQDSGKNVYTFEAYKAFSISERYTRGKLKSPSTAKFPTYSEYSEGVHVADKGDCFFVASYVDSQNDFGATVRTKYYCSVDKRTWKVKDFLTE